MSTDFDALSLLGLLPVVWEVISGSLLFMVLKWFLMLYTVVLFIDVVLLLSERSFAESLKVQFYGTTRPLLSKNKAAERFGAIERRLKSDNLSHYKAAVLEADQFADEVLKESGYGGNNMGERLSGIEPGQLLTYDKLKSAHEVRNRIVNEPNFSLSREEAEELLKKYKALFIELELLTED